MKHFLWRWCSLGVALSVALAVGLPLRAEQAAPWDEYISDATLRYTPLKSFQYEAIEDEETHLVWQANWSATPVSWEQAYEACRAARTGGRKGWRLPTLEELQSLKMVFADANFIGIPRNAPFVFGAPVSNLYWTASTAPKNPAVIMVTSMGVNSNQADEVTVGTHDHNFNYVCVRGGSDHSMGNVF